MVRRSASALALLALLFLAFASLSPAAAFQRMVLAPGCYTLAPGDHVDVPAYCLDQALPPPPTGAALSYAPQGFGSAAIRLADGAPMPLQAALDQHLMQIEGLGDHLNVRLRNLTQTRIELCITAPTIVMGNGVSYTGDLGKIYGQIAKLLSPAEEKSASDSDAHEVQKQLQKKLWSLVNAADQAVSDELSRRLFSGITLPSIPANVPEPASRLSRCSGNTDSVLVCAGK